VILELLKSSEVRGGDKKGKKIHYIFIFGFQCVAKNIE
jgi:hypothetical protein